MASNAQRGAYYKARTKKWLIARGWQVADMEIVRWIYQPGRPPIPIKRDQFASDLVTMKGSRIAFVQVKGGKAAIGGTFPAARREFAKFVWPEHVERWIIAWAPRSRAPRIVNAKESTDGKEEGRKEEGIESFARRAVGEIDQWQVDELKKRRNRAREAPRPARRAVAGHGGASPEQAR